MRKLGPKGRRWLLGLHILLASVWIGASASMNAILIASSGASNGDDLFGRHACLKLLDDFLIIPSAIGMLLTGLLFSLLTNWGFFRFRWVTVKWIAAASLVLFGTFWLGPWQNNLAAITDADRAAANLQSAYLLQRTMLLIFGSLQLGVLIFLAFVSVLKPWGQRSGRAGN